ncbi:cutinase family protein [Mycobacterium sp.]|uniref:cutinase family protein n=1 Tax=Mycobacterium sp. TaxID=1785 RepID=UPI001285D2C1|nr:cutinase family protein [Mycobacterium sp.]KAA8959877.1 MAG: cutinase family protein [Mycobacterium sp.]
MIARVGIRLGVSVAVTAGLCCAAVLAEMAPPAASAQGCPDVEVVFARGTGEEPGVGPTGQAFVDALRSRIGGRSLEVYPVNYPASDQWSTAVDGIDNAGNQVVATARNCPNTKMVLGGYSQGAAVMGFVTSAAVPDGVDPASVPKPMPPDVANHVAAVVLYGMPNARAMNFLGQPQVSIGPLYQAKTIKICVPDDPVCSEGLDFAAHNSYAGDAAIIDQGANFAANHLGENPRPSATTTSPGGGFGS